MTLSRFPLLALGLLSFGVQASVNVAEIQQQINQAGAQWTAKSNWVSELPKDQVRRMLGARDVKFQQVDYSDAYSKSMSYESIDWRNQNGVNWLGPVLNQGNCGSCVAFATVGTFEASVSIQNKTPWLKPQFSPQALFACGGGACNSGWFTSSGASFVKSNGLVDNACAPYTMGSDGKDVSCKQFCNNQSARTVKAAGTFKPTGWLTGASAAKIKEALKKGPLVTSMTVYEDFLAYSGGIYKSVSSKAEGGHAVSIVGYNDAERYWIVRNSWGEDWGEKGFVRISWDDKSGIGGETIGFDVSATPNAVSVFSPKENDYVSGEVTVQTASARADDFSVKLMKDGKEIQTIHMRENGTQSTEALNTTGLEDGKYELVAVSNTDASLKSFVRGFTVANHAPEMSISFTPVDGVDLSKPISGRPEFNVEVRSSPVMMQKIDFMVTKLDGTVVTKRTTDVVLNKMKLGFRTNVLPNGEYYFFYRGTYPAGGKVYTVDSAKVRVTTKN